MATTTDNVIINATINGKKATDELERLQAEAKKLRAAIADAAAAGDDKKVKQLSTALRQTNAEAKNVQRQMFDVNNVLKRLSSASVKELNQAYRKLRSEMESGAIKRGTKEWEEHRQKLRQVSAEINKVRAEQNQTQGGFGKFVDGFNRFGAVGASAIATITGISMTFRQCAADAAKMDDAYSDVMKTTGMTRDEVVELNESFKQMDTRTSREQLNFLASTAGKLGITGRDEVLQFVEGANQIDVALGEDLGEDAIKQIGKMVDVFSDCTDVLQEKNLKEQMLSVGSALNELGASSSASEDYLVQFAGRLGGVSRQAGISMDQILGYASALDQDMQQVEMSATAFSTVITKMMSDPAKFAKAAGMDVKQFSDLVKTDTNAAMLQLLDTLRQTGDFEALTPILKELGLEGTRVTSVLTAMANSTDKIVVAQGVANQAMIEGTSITNEYNVKNNNLQAQLEKAKKEFKDASIALGESLSPALLKSTNATTYLIKGMSELGPWLKENKGLVLTLVTAWTAYAIAVNKAYIAEKAKAAFTKISSAVTSVHAVVVNAASLAYNKLTGNTAKATAAQKALKTAMASTPWGAILAAVSAIGVAVYKWATEQTALEKATKEMNKSLAEETAQSEMLFAAATRAGDGTKRRAEYIKQINDRYGEYLPNLLTEKSTNADLAKALKLVNAELQRKYALQMKEAATGDIVKESTEKQMKALDELRTHLQYQLKDDLKVDEVIEKYVEAIKNGASDIDLLTLTKEIGVKDDSTGWIMKYAQQYRDSYEEMQKEIAAVDKQYNTLLSGNTADKLHGMSKEELDAWIADTKNANSEYLDLAKKLRVDLDKIETTTTTTDTTKTPKDPADGNKTDEEKQKERLAAIEKMLAEERAKYAVEYSIGTKNRQQYEEALRDVELLGINEKMKLYEQGSKEYLELETQLHLKTIDSQKACDAQRLADVKAHFDAQRNILKQSYVDGDIDYKAYQQSLTVIEGAELKERIALYEQGTEEYQKAEEEYNRWLNNENFNKRKSYEEKLKSYREQFSKTSNKELMDAELAAFETLCQNIIVAEEEKQKIIAGIRAKYNNGVGGGDATLPDAWRDVSLTPDEQGTSFWSGLMGDDINLVKKQFETIDQWAAESGATTAEVFQEKSAAVGQFLSNQMQKWSSVIQGVSAITSAVSEYIQAEYEAEAAAVTARYDAEIKAAGKNSKKVAQLEEQKQNELNRLQAEANEKAFGIEIAQAIANMAMSAISAYASASAIPVVGWIMGPIAAGMALAAGAIQIATIRKQHQASKANYWTGGFTPSGAWDKEQGAVHSDEFVANRFAVKNKELRPVLNLIDQAQKDNTVGSLTSKDVSRVLDTGGTNSAEVPSSDTTNVQVAASVASMTVAAERLNKQLDKGVTAVVAITGKNGFEKEYERYQRLEKARKS